MSEPVHDLSRLRIDRDRPSAGSTRALKTSAGLALYLRASGLRVGMLINFIYPKAQIKRIVF